MRLLVITSSLGLGGADRQSLALATAMLENGHEIRLASLTPLGSMGLDAQRQGLDVCTFDAKRGRIPIGKMMRLTRLVRRFRPDLIQGWMYHGNLASSFAGMMATQSTPILWGVRHSLYDLENEKRLTRRVLQVSAPLSRRTRMIIYNARTSVEQHERIGFDATKSHVIPNGFDCELYHPRPEAGARLRRTLGLPDSALLVGMIARFHPQKDHAALIQAAALAAREHPALRLVLIGANVVASNAALMNLLRDHQMADRVCLMGRRQDVSEIVAGLDIAVLSSAYGEGFPNVLGEAMASAVPCVATAVGDCATIVGDAGMVVPRCNPEALAAGISKMAALAPEARSEFGNKARSRIVESFSLGAIARSYMEVYAEVLASRACAA